MKTLLLTDIPPCSNYTGGLVVAQMCRFVPAGGLAIFCVQNAHLRPTAIPDLTHIPLTTVRKPNEDAHQRAWMMRHPPGTWLAETVARCLAIPRLVRKAVDYGRKHEVQSLWAILEGQTLVRMARAVADRLGVPLRAQVWDPLDWWLDAHGVDPISRLLDCALFEKAIRASASCATASWEMARVYSGAYRVPAIPIISSLDRKLAAPPRPRRDRADRLVLGMAGQFYAGDAWRLLVQALTEAGWRVGGRDVYLRVYGAQPPVDTPSERVEFRGWVPQDVLVRELSEFCDLLYCPYPFGARMERVSRLSFPSKLVTYLAAGRPIIFHGPDYSSPATYLRERQAGLVCDSQSSDAIYRNIRRLAEDEELYSRLATAGRQAFLADFTLDRMRVNARSFLGYEN
jgi:glycosyltransferase involved in cell wall biosynthesis